MGAIRYFNAENYLARGGKIDMSAERVAELKGHLLAKAITGTALLAGGLVAVSQRKPDGSFYVTIHGAGPADDPYKRKRYQLMARGWQPYSFKIGNTYIPYEAFPGWMALGLLGNWQDAMRYEGMPPGDQAAGYMLSHSMGMFLDRTTLRGISDFLDALKGDTNDPAGQQLGLERYLATQGKNLIPLAGMGLWRQAYQQFL